MKHRQPQEVFEGREGRGFLSMAAPALLLIAGFGVLLHAGISSKRALLVK